MNENDCVLKFGVNDIPQSDRAWSVIAREDGGRGRHGDCVRGYHEFVWMPEVCEHVCFFFCLNVEEVISDVASFDSDDEWLVGCPKGMDGKFLPDDLEPKYDPDSQNEDTDRD